jgi:hypothetical protein
MTPAMNSSKKHGDAGGQPSICFVMPYFGSWPFWLPFFLESCRANPTVNWLLYTDCGIPSDYPSNVQIIAISYSSYCARVSSVLGITFHPENPYKLCDIRPAFGLIHQEELKDYDFWAFGDIDLVWGNLRSYFTNDRLAHKDIFSTHSRRVSGHCCLIRNTKRMREAFHSMPKWKQLFADPEHRAVDECAFSRLFIRHKNWPQWLSNFASQFNTLRRNAELVEAFSTPNARVPWIDGSTHFPRRWFWQNGRLTNDIDGDREFPYFHFLVWKKVVWANHKRMDERALAQLAKGMAWQISSEGFGAISTSTTE